MKRRKKITAVCLSLAAAFVFAGSSFPAGAAFPAKGAVMKSLVPSAPGTTTYGNEKAVIDASNASQGYVMVKYNGNGEKIKVQVAKAGGVSLSGLVIPGDARHC